MMDAKWWQKFILPFKRKLKKERIEHICFSSSSKGKVHFTEKFIVSGSYLPWWKNYKVIYFFNMHDNISCDTWS